MPKSLASGAVLQRMADTRSSRTHLMTASERSDDAVSFFQILTRCGHTESPFIIPSFFSRNDGFPIAVQRNEGPVEVR